MNNVYEKTSAFDEETGDLHVIIDTPKNSRNKYKFDEKLGLFKLGGVLPVGAFFPFDFGYIPQTLGGDGDPLDALVLLEEPTFPGCLISCRAIGMFRMTDEAGPDEKLLCVVAGDPRQAHIKDIGDISDFDRLEIQHFFEVYKDLEPGKSVEGAEWVGREEAEAEVIASRKRLADDPHAVDHVGEPVKRE